MKYLNMGRGVTLIDTSAFSGCRKLTSVVIPESVSTIYMWAFRYCDSLLDVTIPANVQSIGADTFGTNANIKRSIVVKGKTRAQLVQMSGYPWGIEDPDSEISCEIETMHGRGVNVVRKLTQAQYEALTTKDANTLYVITDIV